MNPTSLSVPEPSGTTSHPTAFPSGSPQDSSSERPRALAVVAHPDDVEFNMAGTLLLLRSAGWDIHIFQIASGNLGSTTLSPEETASLRREEAQAAAELLKATWHPPITEDLEIFYTSTQLRQVGAVIRDVRPRILLTHGPSDYMEDHMATCRLVVTAAFSRAMPNYVTQPPRPIYDGALRIYHAMPHGLCDGFGRSVTPDFYVDTGPVHDLKREALACHASQKDWLDASQGMGSYLAVLDKQAADLGQRSGRFQMAEAWQRHGHLGFCNPQDDPLVATLAPLGRIQEVA